MNWLRKPIVIVLLVILVGLLGWLIYQQFIKSSANDKAPNPTPAAVAPQLAFSEADAQRLETALNSGDKAKQAEVLTDEFGKALLGSGQSLSSGTVQIKPETFVSNGPAAQVAATAVQAGAEQEFILSLEHQNNQWKISLIEPKR